jgi:hypothetical protein
MALRTPPSWLQNGSHPAENDRLTTQAIWKTSGIVNATDLQITQNGGGNMSVNVSSGWAAIVGTTQTNMGTYMAYNDASTNLLISTANPSNPRIDLICVTISDAFYTGTLNQVAFQVVAGTPAASPAVPATPANSLAIGQVLVGAGVSSIITANITNYGVVAGSPFVTATGSATLTNKILASDSFTGPIENSTVSATAATGTINFDCITQGVLYYTTNASANFTLNFRGNSTTTLNSLLAVGQAISVVFLNTNGATPYYANAFQIDGTSVTPKWVGGTASSAGNASAIDSYSFTIVKTAATPTYTVLAGGATKFA